MNFISVLISAACLLSLVTGTPPPSAATATIPAVLPVDGAEAAELDVLDEGFPMAKSTGHVDTTHTAVPVPTIHDAAATLVSTPATHAPAAASTTTPAPMPHPPSSSALTQPSTSHAAGVTIIYHTGETTTTTTTTTVVGNATTTGNATTHDGKPAKMPPVTALDAAAPAPQHGYSGSSMAGLAAAMVVVGAMVGTLVGYKLWKRRATRNGFAYTP